MPGGERDQLADEVAAAVNGDRTALERVIHAVQPQVFQLALRFFGDPRDAEDAAQEALIQIITRLDRFAGRSAFSTWMYRVATNKFLSIARTHRERNALSFDEFDADLSRLPQSQVSTPMDEVDEALLIEEVKIGCTLAMLLCLDRDHRMAYILGEIMEIDHTTAAAILEVNPAAHRKRLQRARERITKLMQARCGLFDPANACRCRLRTSKAVELGRVNPRDLVFATSTQRARHFPVVLREIRRLEQAQRAGALYRSHPQGRSRADLASVIASLFPAAGRTRTPQTGTAQTPTGGRRMPRSQSQPERD